MRLSEFMLFDVSVILLLGGVMSFGHNLFQPGDGVNIKSIKNNFSGY